LIPAARHSDALGHDTDLILLIPDGIDWSDHASPTSVKPPSVVLITTDPAPVLPLPPTATQSRSFSHAIPMTSIALDGAD
jgi:hypothetical protein